VWSGFAVGNWVPGALLSFDVETSFVGQLKNNMAGDVRAEMVFIGC